MTEKPFQEQGHFDARQIHVSRMPDGWEDAAPPSLDNPVDIKSPYSGDWTIIYADRPEAGVLTVVRDRNDLTGSNKPQGVDSRYMRRLAGEESINAVREAPASPEKEQDFLTFMKELVHTPPTPDELQAAKDRLENNPHREAYRGLIDELRDPSVRDRLAERITDAAYEIEGQNQPCDTVARVFLLVPNGEVVSRVDIYSPDKEAERTDVQLMVVPIDEEQPIEILRDVKVWDAYRGHPYVYNYEFPDGTYYFDRGVLRRNGQEYRSLMTLKTACALAIETPIRR